jgi:Na+-transporting NADH:ubiquinone oxidoreductase subunit E
MHEYLNIFIRSIFVENMIFAYFLGMCSYLAVSKNVKTALGMGMAVVFVLVITLPICYLLENYVLSRGALVWLGPAFENVDISFLSFIFFIAVVAAIVQLLEMFMERYMPALHLSFGIFLPLIAVNCAILGACLFMQQKHFSSIGVATTYGLGSGIGWLLAIVGLAAIRDKLNLSDVPKPMRGLGIAFIATALMGLGFMSFSGISI